MSKRFPPFYVHILVSDFKDRYLLGFLGKTVGLMTLKIWLKGSKNVAKWSRTISNFDHTCSLKKPISF